MVRPCGFVSYRAVCLTYEDVGVIVISCISTIID